jgi:DNA-directed RNA polymerase subunit RPC12/RpoP
MNYCDHQLVRKFIARFCAPKLTQPASEWVEQNVRLNEPKIRGGFDFKGREHMRQWVDAWGPLPTDLKGGEKFVGCCGTGIGKTISNIAGICYRIKNEPMRALIVKPTSHGPAGAMSFSKTRLKKTIFATRCLAELVPTGADRFDFSSVQMSINGSVIDITGSNSVGQLGENRCDVVWQDEIDKYPAQTEISKEAGPIVLADERTKNVADARCYKFSTPTLANIGIWVEFLQGDQRRRFVPCPHCKKMIVLAWSKQFTVFEVKGFEAFIRWDEKAREKDGGWDYAKVVKTAHAVCPYCEGKILDKHKPKMNARGEWRATAKGAPGYVSWHLPSMYSISADCGFGQMAKKFLLAKRSPNGVKGFINSDLAEPDVSQQISVNRAGIVGKHIEVTGEWLKVLSVDYHQNAPYFWAVVRAWDGQSKSHGVEYQSFNQWHELDDLQKKHGVIRQAVIVDAGYDQAEVLRNCANIKLKSRCELGEVVQDALPECDGWTPAKAFGGKRMYADKDTGLYKPFRLRANVDPYAGTELAYQMRIEMLEFLSDLFEDSLENIRLGKTFVEWTISKEMDTDEYHRHIAGKKRVYKKNSTDYRWETIRPGYADHLRSCELLNLVLAYRLQLISFEAIQTKEKDKK